MKIESTGIYKFSSADKGSGVVDAAVVVVDRVSLSRSVTASAGQVLLKYAHVAVLTFLISGTGSMTVPPIPIQNVRTALTMSPERAPCGKVFVLDTNGLQ